MGSENYGAWLHDPIDGTAYVYVNTYFKPRAGYVVYQPDTTQITKLEATFEGTAWCPESEVCIIIVG